ncbi:MAG: TetR/AcrR family transcriptional regulator [Ktedonobacteraceae bacterium]
MNTNSETAKNDSVHRVSRRKARTRADLLAAARRVFAARGYHEASIAEITQAADVGVGTFYLHFRDKDEIFTTLIEEGLRDIREQVTAAALQQPYEQMLPAVVRLTFRYAYAERDLFRIALTGGGQLARKFRAQTPLIEGFTQILEAAHDQGLLAGYHTALLARFITGIVTQGIAWWFEHDEPGPDEMAEQVMQLLRRGLPADFLIEEKETS